MNTSTDSTLSEYLRVVEPHTHKHFSQETIQSSQETNPFGNCTEIAEVIDRLQQWAKDEFPNQTPNASDTKFSLSSLLQSSISYAVNGKYFFALTSAASVGFTKKDEKKYGKHTWLTLKAGLRFLSALAIEYYIKKIKEDLQTSNEAQDVKWALDMLEKNIFDSCRVLYSEAKNFDKENIFSPGFIEKRQESVSDTVLFLSNQQALGEKVS